MLRESATFNFGYYYSQNMVVFCTALVYAIHTPLITFIGFLYFFMRNIFDTHLIMNIY